MTQPQVVLGIDGGGSVCRALLVSTEGNILASGTAGPANPKAVGWTRCRAAVREAVAAAWGKLGESPRPAAAAYCGLAGLGRPQDEAEFLRRMASLRLAPPSRLGCGTDLEIALEGGLAGREGLILVAGTGSACHGRNAAGQTVRVGGWGWLMDDPGSGYWLGVQALRAAVRAHDGRAPMNALAAAVQAHFGLPTLTDLPLVLYRETHTSGPIAALAPLVFSAAAAGDRQAQSIVQEGAEELAQLVWTAAARLGLTSSLFSVALAGGVGESQPGYFQAIERALATRSDRARLVKPLLPPVVGAGLRALRLAGVEVSQTLRLQLQEAI